MILTKKLFPPASDNAAQSMKSLHCITEQKQEEQQRESQH